MVAYVGTGCAKRTEALCNHFYFPLLASLLSDLDFISQGRQRQRQNKGMLVVLCCVCVCAHLLLFFGATEGEGAEEGVGKLRSN